MAEAAKIMHTDKEYAYKILGKYLRIDDRKLLEASYNVEIKALEPRLAIKPEGLQSTLEEIASIDPRAKTVKPQEMVDTRYLDEMEKAASWISSGEGRNSCLGPAAAGLSEAHLGNRASVPLPCDQS
jgi:hypothetical protein